MEREKNNESNVFHPTADISPKASIGKGTRIWQNSIIQEDVEIGENCKLGANVFLERGVKLGEGVKVKNNVALYTGVICEDHVFLGPNCVFTNVLRPRSFISRKKEFKQTIIQRGATIGANATIICGHTIGKYAMVAAGAVVTKDVPAYTLVIGTPARVRGFICECGYDLDEDYRCLECGRTYQFLNNGFNENNYEKGSKER